MIESWQDKVGNVSQFGGIETSVLDNGPAAGSRVAWFNTGSGLRFKIAIDRGLDIVDAFYNQYSLAWISHGGLTAPSSSADIGTRWLNDFPGGLLTTCGLSHIGGPESDDNESRGIHGRISHMPASIESVIQPDPQAGRMEMSITGIMKESKVFGPHLELRRTITCTLGEPVIKIFDEVTNRGNTFSPHMLLYHCNFGWPLVDEGSDIIYQGSCQSRGMDFDNALFNDSHDYTKCQKPLNSHKGAGESCGFIDAQSDNDGMCHVGLVNRSLNLGLTMKYKKAQLPALTNWQHWGPGEYVCALEPGTNSPIGQNQAKALNELVVLPPGERKTYQLEFSILSEAGQVNDFVNKTM